MVDIGRLVGYIDLEDKFSSGLDLASRKFDKFAGDFNRLGNTLSGAGRTMSLAITAPMVAAAGASLALSGRFEEITTRLSSLAGVASKDLPLVRQHMLDLAPKVGIGPYALAEAMTKVSSTVADTKVAMSILDIAAKGSAAGMGAAVDVAGALTSVINSYGSANITAARAGDILTQAIKDGGAEAKELAPTLANIVPLAAQMGVSFEEVAANIATVTKLGTPASEAVTQLTSVLTALNKETAEGKEALAAVGLSYQGLRDSVNEGKGGPGLLATIELLTQKFHGNTTGLTAVFGRMEAVKDMMAVSGAQAETYATVLDNAKSSVGRLDEAFKAMEGTQTHTWNQVKAQAEAVAIAFGDQLAPSLKKVLEASKPLLEIVTEMVSWFGKLPGPIQTVVLGVAAFVAAGGPLLMMFGGMASGIGSIISGAKILHNAWTMLGNTVPVLTARLWLMETATTAVGKSLVTLGMVMGSLGAVFIGAKITQWVEQFAEAKLGIDGVNSALNKLGPDGSLLDKFKAINDSVNRYGSAYTAAQLLHRAWRGEVEQPVNIPTGSLNEATMAIRNLKEEMSGAIASKNADQLKTVFKELSEAGQLSEDVLRRIANAAKQAQASGGDIGKDLQQLVDFENARAAAAEKEAAAQNRRMQQQELVAAAAKELAKRQFEVNQKIADATRDVGNLTDAQKSLIVQYDRLGLSAEDIGIKLGISSISVTKFTEKVKHEAEMLATATEMAEEMGKTMRARDIEEANERAKHVADSFVFAQSIQEKMYQSTLKGTALKLRQIEIEKQADIARLTFQGQISDRNKAIIDAYYAHQVKLATNSQDTIIERMEAAGELTKATLGEQAFIAQVKYEQMKLAGVGVWSNAALERARQEWIKATQDANEDANKSWQDHLMVVNSVAEAIGRIGGAIGGPLGGVISSVGNLVGLWAAADDALRKYDATQKAANKANQITAISGGIAGVISAGSQGGFAESGINSALAALGAAKSIASSFGKELTGIQATYGMIAGMAYGLVTAWMRHREETELANKKIKEINAELAQTYLSLDNAREMASRFGIALGSKQGGKGGLKDLEEDLKKFQAEMDKVRSAVEKYGLTWKDLRSPQDRMRESTMEASTLIQTYDRLVKAGYSAEAITRGMSGDVNKWLSATLDAGVGIPKAMGPIILELIKSKKLTEENAAAMLGFKKDAMPSLADITAAAGRYGLKLDELGPKVAQLSFTDRANQIVTDFNLLTQAGVPFETLMSDIVKKMEDGSPAAAGMKKQIQDLVTEALTAGMVLPESMRGIIDKLIEAGGLTDEFGVKLVDTSRLKFETPLVDAIEALILKLDQLILKFIEVGGTQVPPVIIPYEYRRRGDAPPIGVAQPRGTYDPVTDEPTEAPTTEPEGGTTPLAGTARPRSSEITGSNGEFSAPATAPIEITVVSQLDGYEIARNQVRYLPGVTEAADGIPA